MGSSAASVISVAESAPSVSSVEESEASVAPVASVAAPRKSPPEQMSAIMEMLSRAVCHIADIRTSADHVVNAIFVAFDVPCDASRVVQMLNQEKFNMSQHFRDLIIFGRQLEESGLLTEALKQQCNSWGLHMHVVCPDQAAISYAWYRQLAAQGSASAVDKARLALKAFAEQKRKFFPQLENDSDGQSFEEDTHVMKKQCTYQNWMMSHMDNFREQKSLSDIFAYLKQEAPEVKVSTYNRYDWKRRASSLSNVDLKEPVSKHVGLGPGVASASPVSVIEVLVPSIFRAVVSLSPAGSIIPDAVAFFSPDECGNYIHARGQSSYHVFGHIAEYANKAIHYFLSLDPDIALCLLLHWVSSYQTLFSMVCSKCKRLMAMEKYLLLPPVHRPYQFAIKVNPNNQPSFSARGLVLDQTHAYHISCSLDEAK